MVKPIAPIADAISRVSSSNNFFNDGRKIVCVARNYKSHCQETGKPIPEKPIFFLKPPSSMVMFPRPILIPEDTLVEHEVEFGVVMGRTARNIPEDHAMNYVRGYTLAIDVTARKMQRELAKEGLPWTIAKGMDTFCPVTKLIDVSEIPDPQNVNFELYVNNVLQQTGNTSQMIFPITKLISEASKYMTLQKNDLMLTGTPSGVGPLRIGDRVKIALNIDQAHSEFFCVPFPTKHQGYVQFK
ncbi:Fumarylacetoacetase domain-containing protein [Rozella allomycis CSF55]|uniref:Fumarylacetoacetase domain-containing protein n=1 Tax=Rozella allomycis (strain CSF55) TaxID=988480 RepID=A0A075AQU3_ROZAC|nr:Fumarylacetoacetase domain-containing protein [Rozella allomycis CSF55]|eukprot:EPZ30962.1 Fumarylacetoacetase domain-containing protein [Rozella allomycis CSF55]